MAFIETVLYVDDYPWNPGLTHEITPKKPRCEIPTENVHFPLYLEFVPGGRYFLRSVSGECIMQGPYVISNEAAEIVWRFQKNGPLYRLVYRTRSLV